MIGRRFVGARKGDRRSFPHRMRGVAGIAEEPRFAARGLAASMKTAFFSLAALACAGLFFAGCNGFEHRAEQKSATFNALDDATQQRLKSGNIAVGDTPDMVYIALGVPDAKRQRLTSDGREVIWVYKTYYQDYRGTELIGYRRYFVPAGPNRYVVHFEPVAREVYDERSEENMRITFVNDHVSSVEQVQR